ncbi:DUF4222 domain-containing protein [Klebsiella quasivariicola]|uniref:DUF4222 domain-containing protein n=1 Tax=Klebsiella quasivariicola TaxID=2026240 RepID=UPI0038D0C79F
MEENIQPMDRLYRDQHGIVVHATGYDAARQRVIYRRPGYEWECVAPMIIFRARFKRIDK